MSKTLPRRDMGLGSYGKAEDQVTLAEARQLAAKYRAIVNSGKDPIIERDREIAAIASGAWTITRATARSLSLSDQRQ